MIRGHSCLHKSRMTDWKGWSSSYLNLMCNKEEEALMSQHTVMTNFTLHCLKDYYIKKFIGTFQCMLLHERLLQNTFKWLFFPHNSLSARCFILLLCKGILTHCAAHLGAVNTETGFERRRRRGNLVNLCGVHGVHIERARLCRLFSRGTSQHFRKCIPPASNQSTQDAHYGLPSPRKKMRFFAIFWLRVCMVSAFCRVRWAQSFQNLGSFSDSVRDDKADKLGS